MAKNYKNHFFLIILILIVATLVIVYLQIQKQKNAIVELDYKRKELIQFIFKNNSLPHNYPDKITPSLEFKSSTLLVEKYSTIMPNNVTSESYLFRPKNANGKLIIFAAAHFRDVRTYFNNEISFFLNKNYSLLAFSLPTIDKAIPHGNHKQLLKYETENFSTISYFTKPIAVSLNYAIDKYGYSKIIMTGISGGGWLTSLYSALDNRILKSYPVAGSLPDDLLNDTQKGDYEYNLEPLYKIADYYDIYVLSSDSKNRTQVQILNLNDDCCFQGSLYLKKPYENIIKKRLNLIGGGEFKVLIINESSHIYTKEALETILIGLESI